MRKVRDYYFNKAKKEKYPARSVFKLEEVQKKYRLFRRGDAVLDLGCHPGSWSLYASAVVGPTGLVVGVDLQDTGKEPRDGGSPIHWICGDITEGEPYNGYLVYQGGIPEVEEFIKKFHK